MIYIFLRYFVNAEDDLVMVTFSSRELGNELRDQRGCQDASRYLMKIFMEANSCV